MISVGKGFGLLDLVASIVKNIRNIESGEIVIYNDNKKLIREIHKEVMKESECTGEAGAIVEVIRRELKKSHIEISIEYSNNKPYPNKEFYQ